LSIGLLLENSENLGEHRFDVPDIPHGLVVESKFLDKYYEDYYDGILKICQDFSDFQTIYLNDKTNKTYNIFAKLISKDQLFVIKINTFKGFKDESIKYIKKGRNVFIKATYYQINNVMIGLKYNEYTSILSDLNPDYATTHEWTKEYFDIEKNMHIDYSDFELDYYYEEDEDEWLNLEKSLDNIIKNFITYLNARHEILYSEYCIKQIRDCHMVNPEDFKKVKKNAFCCSFKINITDLVLLVLELKRSPPYDTYEEQHSMFELDDNMFLHRSIDSDITLERFRSERPYPPNLSLASKSKTSTPGMEKASSQVGISKSDSISKKIILLNRLQ
jgi:hypothetical protein